MTRQRRLLLATVATGVVASLIPPAILLATSASAPTPRPKLPGPWPAWPVVRREAQVAQLHRAMCDPTAAAAVVAVTGGPGVGKSVLLRDAIASAPCMVELLVGAQPLLWEKVPRGCRAVAVDMDVASTADAADAAASTPAPSLPPVLVVATRDPSRIPPAMSPPHHLLHLLIVGDLTDAEARQLLVGMGISSSAVVDELLLSIGRNAGDLVDAAQRLNAGSNNGNSQSSVRDVVEAMVAACKERLAEAIPPLDVIEPMPLATIAIAPAIRSCRLLQSLASCRPMRLSNLIATSPADDETAVVGAVQQLMDAGIALLVADDGDGDPILQMSPLMARAWAALRTDPAFERDLDRLLLQVQLHNTAVELREVEAQLQRDEEALATDMSVHQANAPVATTTTTDDDQAATARRHAWHERQLLLHEAAQSLQMRRGVLNRQQARLDEWRIEAARADRPPNVSI